MTIKQKIKYHCLPIKNRTSGWLAGEGGGDD